MPSLPPIQVFCAFLRGVVMKVMVVAVIERESRGEKGKEGVVSGLEVSPVTPP